MNRRRRTTIRTQATGRNLRRPLSAAAVGAALVLLAACGGGSGGVYGGSAAPAATTAGGSMSADHRVGTAKTALGQVLTDGAGRTLYILTADSPGASSCTDACIGVWPVVTPASGHAADVTAALGSIKRSDGTAQLTVDGMPAYTYAADRSAGDTNGQGVNSFGGIWWALGLDGKPVTTAASTSSGGGRY